MAAILGAIIFIQGVRGARAGGDLRTHSERRAPASAAIIIGRGGCRPNCGVVIRCKRAGD